MITFLYICAAVIVFLFVMFGIFIVTFVVGLTIQGKMVGGLTRKQAYKELLKEFFGVK